MSHMYWYYISASFVGFFCGSWKPNQESRNHQCTARQFGGFFLLAGGFFGLAPPLITDVGLDEPPQKNYAFSDGNARLEKLVRCLAFPVSGLLVTMPKTGMHQGASVVWTLSPPVAQALPAQDSIGQSQFPHGCFAKGWRDAVQAWLIQTSAWHQFLPSSLMKKPLLGCWDRCWVVWEACNALLHDPQHPWKTSSEGWSCPTSQASPWFTQGWWILAQRQGFFFRASWISHARLQSWGLAAMDGFCWCCLPPFSMLLVTTTRAATLVVTLVESARNPRMSKEREEREKPKHKQQCKSCMSLHAHFIHPQCTTSPSTNGTWNGSFVRFHFFGSQFLASFLPIRSPNINKSERQMQTGVIVGTVIFLS